MIQFKTTLVKIAHMIKFIRKFPVGYTQQMHFVNWSVYCTITRKILCEFNCIICSKCLQPWDSLQMQILYCLVFYRDDEKVDQILFGPILIWFRVELNGFNISIHSLLLTYFIVFHSFEESAWFCINLVNQLSSFTTCGPSCR